MDPRRPLPRRRQVGVARELASGALDVGDPLAVQERHDEEVPLRERELAIEAAIERIMRKRDRLRIAGERLRGRAYVVRVS